MDSINISISLRVALRHDPSASSTGAVRIDVTQEKDQKGSIAVSMTSSEIAQAFNFLVTDKSACRHFARIAPESRQSSQIDSSAIFNVLGILTHSCSDYIFRSKDKALYSCILASLNMLLHPILA